MTSFDYTLATSPGTGNYEVRMLTEDSQRTYLDFLYDTIGRLVILHTNRFYKINVIGSIIDATTKESMRLYDNGIIKKHSSYSEWLINGDSTFFKAMRVPSPKGNDAFAVFDDDYNKAEYYVRSIGGDPSFKINGEWIIYGPPFDNDLEEYLSSDDAKKKYPLKPSNRFVPMQEIGPDFGIAPEKRDTSLLKSLGYAVVDKEEEDWGLTKHRYSAGFYNMELYLPGGDTLRFRHFGALGINLEVFRVPKTYGGRDDVFFIAQDPNPLYPDLSTGGVYVVRPRYLPPEAQAKPSRLGVLLQGTGR